jgi:DNA-binding response OmpR family regulator
MSEATSITLLLIEDDVQCARMVAKVLTPYGYTIHHAKTGLAGLQLARSIEPQIILLDMGLPDLDGKIIANQLRGFTCHDKRVPVVAFTAESGARAQRMALAMGCDKFISKPIDTREFPGQIAHIMETGCAEGLKS